jgi:tRNA threonylcarbamoyladenosine biosynthesis protein TsaB
VSPIEPVDDPLILAIETATRAGSVAVARGDSIIAIRAGDAAVSHSENLIEMIEEVLSRSGATLTEVGLFAAAIGPGSFTGLRIGLATVKALAVSTRQKIGGVSTLAAVAHAAAVDGRTVALLPAGRGEVFAQMFSVNQGNIHPEDEPAHLTPKALLEKYGSIRPLNWAGEGARQYFNALKDGAARRGFAFNAANSDGSLWSVIDQNQPLAGSVAILAHEAGEAVSPEHLHAVYVRASDAEINERWLREKAEQPAQN